MTNDRLLDVALGALNKIASWGEGKEVGSHFDDPTSAAIARQAITKIEGQLHIPAAKVLIMKISEVNIAFIKPNNGLIGFASIVVDDALYMGSIGIHQKLNQDGYRLTYPTKQAGMQRTDIFHPINSAAGKAIESAIMNKLNDVMKKANNHAGHDSNLYT